MIKDNKYLNEKLEIVKSYKVYEMGSTIKVKISAISLASKKQVLLSLTSTDITDLVFEYYYIAI